MPKTPKRKKRGSFAWVDPKTKHLYARVRVKRQDGTVKTFYKRAKNLTHAEQLADEIKAEHEVRGDAFIDGSTMTFKALAEWYKARFVVEPTYVNGKRIAGMRTWEAERRKIDRITERIGDILVNDLDEDDLTQYKVERLKSGASITTVNRDLESIRAMFRKAVKKKWRKEPIDFDELIDKSLEARRTVTIADKQETKILAEARKLFEDKSAPRLYALILALRDSGARPSELYPVNDHSEGKAKYEPIRWRDLLDDDGEVKDVTQLVSYKGKQREVRIAVVTERMKAAFIELKEQLDRSKRIIPAHRADPDNLVFPHTTFKKSWQIVRDAAGVPELRLRDLRRDWVTRLAKLGYSDKLAQRGAGHKTLQMSFEYTEFDLAAAMQAKAILDADNGSQKPVESEMVN